MRYGNIEYPNVIDTTSEVVHQKFIDDYTKLLLHMDGINQATTFVESARNKTVTNTANYDTYTKLMLHLENNVTDSATAKTVTNNNVTFSSSTAVYGAYSASFNGTNSTLTIPTSADWAFGTGDFTVEGWFKRTLGTTNDCMFSTTNYAATVQGWAFWLSGTGLNFAATSGGGSWDVVPTISSDAVAITNGNWYHLVVTRSGTSIKFFVNGVQYGGGTSGGNIQSSGTMYIGNFSGAGGPPFWNGYMDELRISKGVARWTANFHWNYAPYGQVATVDTYKFGGGAANFDGGGAYLSIPDSSDWVFGNNDFTIDFWMNPSYVAGTQVLLGQSVTSDGSKQILVSLYNGDINFIVYNETYVPSARFNTIWGTGLAVGTWYHIAIVRSGSTVFCFKNGVAQSVTSGSSFIGGEILPDISDVLTLGVRSYTTSSPTFYNGLLDEVRISKGVARWTSNFTAPTQSYETPLDTQTKLLIHGQGPELSTTFYDNSITSRTLTTNGNTHFNAGGSALFDGSGDYLTVPDSDDWYFGTGDFTVEFWVRFSSVVGDQIIIAQRADDSNMWNIQKDASQNLYFAFKFGGTYKGLYYYTWTGVNINTWYHIGFVRTGTTAKLFINGAEKTLTESVAFSTNDVGNIAGVLNIGQLGNASQYLFGWMDEIRISKGIARWTTPFNPGNAPYEKDSYTKLLLHCDGRDTLTTFYDDCGNTVTANGNAQIDTAYWKIPTYKFRVSSIHFDGTGDTISAPDSTDWVLGTSNFTWDFWVKFSSISSDAMLIAQDPAGVSHQYLIRIAGTNKLYFSHNTAGDVSLCNVNIDWTPTVGVWYHVAVERKDTSILMFINGVSQTVNVITAIGTNSLTDIAAPLEIGGGSVSASYLNGWMDEVRISVGIARWIGNFTPPSIYDSPVAQYVIDGLDGDTDKEYGLISRAVDGQVNNSSYYMRINNDTGNNYGLQYMYGNNATATAARNTSLSSWSLNFQTGGNANNGAFAEHTLYVKSGKVRTMTTKAIEYLSGTTVSYMTIGGWSWNNTVDNVTSLVFRGDYANSIGPGTHIILIKKRQLTSGVKAGELSLAGKAFGHWQLLYDNTLTSAKQSIMLSSNIDTYTKLLIHADGADASTAFYDCSNNHHIITANGNAQVDAAQAKFGNGSLLLDGNGDYLTIPNSTDFAMGTGDFTFDFWVKFNNLPTNGNYMSFFNAQAPGTDSIDWVVYNSSGTYHLEFFCTGIDVDRTVTLTTATWYHIAFVRNGSNFYIFLNGVQQGATFTSSTAYITPDDTIYIGGYPLLPGQYVDGWMDEIRLSKGIARWTGNFTPPTEAYNEFNGDVDTVYKIMFRGVWGTTTGTSFYLLRLNQDTGSNYGSQLFAGRGVNIDVVRGTSNTAIYFAAYSQDTNNVSLAEVIFYVKSGNVRSVISHSAHAISGTTVSYDEWDGQDWNNVTDKITSMLIDANAHASGLGAGTHIEVWRLNLV